jgi:SAM-dependent methyltransferase
MSLGRRRFWGQPGNQDSTLISVSQPRPYTSQWLGWRAFLRACLNDVKAHSQDPGDAVESRLNEARAIEQLFFGCRLENVDILDIGPGQVPVQLMYFSQMNRAIGIDVNRIVYRRTPSALLQVFREAGPLRAVKTLGRWTLGSDTRLRESVARELGTRKMSWPVILQMDVRKMEFPDESFDLVYSRSVFQHIENPSLAIQEIARVLRHGGGVHISLHLWTCPNGFTYVPASSYDWPHLTGRALPHEIDQSRNQLRLAEWRAIFEKSLPGCELRLRGPEIAELIDRAKVFECEELHSYSLEELINYELSVFWRKPR